MSAAEPIYIAKSLWRRPLCVQETSCKARLQTDNSARFADFRNPLDSHAFVLHFHSKDQIQIVVFQLLAVRGSHCTSL